MAKLLGLSRYGNERNVYDRIVEEAEDEWNANMERGAAVEPQLRAYGQNVLGLELEDRESDYHSHPALDFAWAQVDDIARWKGQPVAVDYKSQSRWAKGWGAEGSDEVPEHIRAQVMWELLCTGRELGLLIVGFGDDAPPPDLFHIANVVTYQVQRDEDFERYCVLVAKNFWERCVLPRSAPSIKPIGKRASK